MPKKHSYQKHLGVSGPSERQLKVAESIRRIISDALNIDKIYFDLISEASLTVTEVRISPDLKNATVFIIPFAISDANKIIKVMNDRTDIIKSYLANKAKLRYIPNLIFRYDNSFEEAQKINNIIETIEK